LGPSGPIGALGDLRLGSAVLRAGISLGRSGAIAGVAGHTLLASRGGLVPGCAPNGATKWRGGLQGLLGPQRLDEFRQLGVVQPVGGDPLPELSAQGGNLSPQLTVARHQLSPSG